MKARMLYSLYKAMVAAFLRFSLRQCVLVDLVLRLSPLGFTIMTKPPTVEVRKQNELRMNNGRMERQRQERWKSHGDLEPQTGVADVAKDV